MVGQFVLAGDECVEQQSMIHSFDTIEGGFQWFSIGPADAVQRLQADAVAAQQRVPGWVAPITLERAEGDFAGGRRGFGSDRWSDEETLTGFAGRHGEERRI